MKFLGRVRHGSYGYGSKLTDTTDFSPLGYEPYRGTLNLKIRKSDWEKLSKMEGIHIPEEENHLSHVWVPLTIEGIAGHFRTYLDKPRIEVVSLVHLRTELGLKDGDTVVCQP